MDYLYRIFYIVLSLGVLMIILLPVVLIFRFLVRSCERKYMMWQWKLLFLRSVCPFFMSSMFCFMPVWNRRFYVFLGNLGLTLREKKGVIFSVSDVFTYRIFVTQGFKICSILWLFGVLLFLLFQLYNKFRLTMTFATAKELGEDIYEVSSIHLPVQTGIFHKSWFLPPEFHASELKWLMKHMENRGAEPLKRVFLMFIFAIHWFNPVMWLYYYLWSQDNEIHADERAVYHGNMMRRREYAQSIMNFRRRIYSHRNAAGVFEEDKVSDNFGIYVVYERDTEKRARRMMYQKWDGMGRRFFAKTLVLGVLAYYFLLAPLNKVWAGGTWKADLEPEQTVEKTADKIQIKKREVIANADAMSPEGLSRILQLEMKSGGSKDEDGFDGDFTLVMYDQLENKLSYLDMNTIFSHSMKSSYHFSNDLILYVADYNGDGKQEVTLGQRMIPTQKEFSELVGDEKKTVDDYEVYQYSIISLDTNQLILLGQEIYSVTEKNDQSSLPPTESITFEKVEGVNGLFAVNFAGKKKYYEWISAEGNYEEKEYTAEEIEAKQNGTDTTEIGKAGEHTLEDAGGDTAILVSTEVDNTSSEAIQSVILSPRKSQKRLEDVKGYYCDLFWAPSLSSGTEDRYAVLLYNGVKSRTFVIYDVKERSVYYRQEDGARELGKLFKQYNEDGITFHDGGVVLYDLSEKNEDTLKIDFYAMADGKISIKGSYEYNVKKKLAANLRFSQSIDADAEKAAPTPDIEGIIEPAGSPKGE
ncbi:MAG: hypothetical protein IJ733_05415 [Lachnospiraceae bacterium]|nr:hypothetical protein [Lachnospiraceae bacterium]